MDQENDSPDWLKETLTKEQAESFLKEPEKSNHSFLVRTSNVNQWLTLSIKVEDKIKHYKIYKDNEDFYYFFETRKFDNLKDLIKHYSENNFKEIIYPTQKKGNEKSTRKESESEKVVKRESYTPPLPKRSPNLVPLQPKNTRKENESESEKVVKRESYTPPLPKKCPNVVSLQQVLKKKSIEPQQNKENPNEIVKYTSTNLIENVKDLSRLEAEKYLRDKKIYSYLIRTSKQTGHKCLSLKTEQDVEHYVIYSHGSQFYIHYGDCFSSINELIEMYSKNNWDDLLKSKCDLYPSEDNTYDYANLYEDCKESYMKTFSRKEAENYLSKLSIFSYLVRPSNKSELSLSVKMKDRVFHYLIHKKDPYYYIYDWSLFLTVHELVKTYAENDFEDLLNPKPKKEITETAHFERVCKDEIKMELMNKPYYSYVLRDSSNFNGCKCLSVKFPEDILYCTIYSSKEGFYIYKYDRFGTIDELIECYSKNQWQKLIKINRLDERGRIAKFLSWCGLKLRKNLCVRTQNTV